jgi:hypothetical protein
MKTVASSALVLALLAAAACDNGTSSTPTTPAPTVAETLSGIIPAPTGGAQPSAFVTFNSAASGTGSVTLTSAIETLSTGALNPAVVVGLQLGVPSGNSCAVAAGSTPLLVQSSPTPISAPFVAGANCLLLTSGDQSATAGPVAFTVVVVHF